MIRIVLFIHAKIYILHFELESLGRRLGQVENNQNSKVTKNIIDVNKNSEQSHKNIRTLTKCSEITRNNTINHKLNVTHTENVLRKNIQTTNLRESSCLILITEPCTARQQFKQTSLCTRICVKLDRFVEKEKGQQKKNAIFLLETY